MKKMKPIFRYSFLVITVGMALLAVVIHRHLPLYESVVLVKISQPRDLTALLDPNMMEFPVDPVAARVQMAKSDPFIRKLALRLSWVNEKASPRRVIRTIARIRERIVVRQLGSAPIIEIRAFDLSARKAAAFADSAASILVEEHLSQLRVQTLATQEYITKKLESLQVGLATDEDNMARVPSVGPYYEKLLSLELELSALRSRYTDRHPRIQHIQEEMKSIRQRVENIGREDLKAGVLAREVQSNRQLYFSFKEKLEDALIFEARHRKDVSIINPATVPYQQVPMTKRMKILLAGMPGVIMGPF